MYEDALLETMYEDQTHLLEDPGDSWGKYQLCRLCGEDTDSLDENGHCPVCQEETE